MRFAEFFKNYKEPEPEKTPEAHFYEAVGVNVPSLDGLISWLILSRKIKPYIMSEGSNRPVSFFDLPYNRKILYLAKNLPKIREYAEEFANKWNQ